METKYYRTVNVSKRKPPEDKTTDVCVLFNGGTEFEFVGSLRFWDNKFHSYDYKRDEWGEITNVTHWLEPIDDNGAGEEDKNVSIEGCEKQIEYWKGRLSDIENLMGQSGREGEVQGKDHLEETLDMMLTFNPMNDYRKPSQKEDNNLSVGVFKINIDGKRFTFQDRYIVGAQIKALVNARFDYGVWLKSKDGDKQIENNETVDLKQPDRNTFFTGSLFTTEGQTGDNVNVDKNTDYLNNKT